MDLAKQMKVVEANTPDAAETIEVLKVMLYGESLSRSKCVLLLQSADALFP